MPQHKPLRGLAIALLLVAFIIGTTSLLGLIPVIEASKARLLFFPEFILSLFLAVIALALWKHDTPS